MNSKEAELKVKFDYEGQKRAILMPQPLKYHQLIEKLQELCGSKFTIEYSAAKGEFIREIECQEDLDDVIGLTRSSFSTVNCLPLRLVRCSKSSSSVRPHSIAGDSQLSWYSSLSSAYPKGCGGFFHSEIPEFVSTSTFKRVNSEYIPEMQDSLHSSFIPDSSSDIQSFSSSRHNGKNGRGVRKLIPFPRNPSKNYLSKTETPSRFSSSLDQDSGCPLSIVECNGRPDVSTLAKVLSEDECTRTPSTPQSRDKAEATTHGKWPPAAVTASTDASVFDRIGDRKKDFESKMENLSISGFTPGRWVKGRLLGQGAFGQVFTGYDIDRGVEFAVKQVQIYAESHEVELQIESLEMEISILQGIHHDHIVEYYGMQRDPSCLSIFIEFIPMGSLKDHINRYGCLTEKVTSLYTNQVLKGLTYLHSKMIIHRDIKCANILRDHHGNLKLGDFGASKLLQSQSVAATSKIAGTPYFMAPEIIRGEACSCRCDIWSLGCTVVEMLTKNPPWHQYDTLAAIYKIGSTWPPEYSLPDETSDNVKSFLELCFAESANDRPKAQQLLLHNFIAAMSFS